jgi:hypothetical protein
MQMPATKLHIKPTENPKNIGNIVSDVDSVVPVDAEKKAAIGATPVIRAGKVVSYNHLGTGADHASAGPGCKRTANIKSIIRDIHNEICPEQLLTAFRLYWPHLKVITMREAWIRVVYMEAIQGQPWASYFIADRDEGKVSEVGMPNNRGSILEAFDQEMKNPVTEGSVL